MMFRDSNSTYTNAGQGDDVLPARRRRVKRGPMLRAVSGRQALGHALAARLDDPERAAALRASADAAATKARCAVPAVSAPHPTTKLRRWRKKVAALDAAVLAWIERNAAGRPSFAFCAEEIGVRLNVRVDQVKHALHRLNLRGLVSQARRMAPGGRTGGRAWGHDLDWGANAYDYRGAV